ncbi:hypothetical protein L1887_31621 [Cichorium endivia]|nr:hypothetical protein L1887_31621 [Cichorium endivia]
MESSSLSEGGVEGCRAGAVVRWSLESEVRRRSSLEMVAIHGYALLIFLIFERDGVKLVDDTISLGFVKGPVEFGDLLALQEVITVDVAHDA